MKSVALPQPQFSAQSMNPANDKNPDNKNSSPYLKAVLTGKTNTEVAQAKSQAADTSLAAALRYIANSK